MKLLAILFSIYLSIFVGFVVCNPIVQKLFAPIVDALKIVSG